MPNLHVRDVDDQDVEVLREAANAQNMSFNAFLKGVLVEAATRARREAAVRRIEQRVVAADHPKLTHSQLLAALDAAREAET